MNDVKLFGRLSQEPVVWEPEEGSDKKCVVHYSIAVDRNYSSDNKKSTDFVRVVCFGKAAEIARKYLHKGSQVLVQARIQTGSYTDKNGETVYTQDIVVSRQTFVEPKEAEHEPETSQELPERSTDARSYSEQECEP